jgi:hypothetical protein
VGLERGPLSLVSTIEELLQRKISGSGLETENTAVGIRYADHVVPCIRKKLELTSPISGGRSVGKIRSWTQATEFLFFLLLHSVEDTCGSFASSLRKEHFIQSAALWIVILSCVIGAIPATGRVTSMSPHCLDGRIIDSGEVVSLTFRPHSAPQKHFLQRISLRGCVNPQGHSEAGRIMSIEKIQRPHRHPNPRPSVLWHTASTNYARLLN